MDPKVVAKILMGGYDRALGGIRAYHGSPHRFDKFDASKIGSGEGAQAYGHGLYFAENPKTALTYKDANIPATAPPRRTLFGRELVPATPEYHAGTLLETMGRSIPGVRKEVEGWIAKAKPGEDIEHYKSVLDTLNKISSKKDFSVLPPSGHLYEVNIKAKPEQFLNWDAPASQQPANVKNFFNIPGPPKSPGDSEIRSLVQGALKQDKDPRNIGLMIDALMDRSRPGEHLYKEMVKTPTNSFGYSVPPMGTDVVTGAADKMRQAGIPGIRYLDQVSRDVGKGTHNYTVFDPNLIDILKRYGIAAPGAATAASVLQQDQPIQ